MLVHLDYSHGASTAVPHANANLSASWFACSGCSLLTYGAGALVNNVTLYSFTIVNNGSIGAVSAAMVLPDVLLSWVSVYMPATSSWSQIGVNEVVSVRSFLLFVC